MDLHPDDQGGAVIRLSSLELTAYYNLLNKFLSEAAPGEASEWTYAMRVQRHQLAVALGRADIPHPDDQ